MRAYQILKSIALLGLVFGHSAHAAIVSVEGSIQEISPIDNVANGSIFQRNGVANIFAEQSDVTLTSALSGLNTSGANVDGVLDVGIRVSSYYLFTDPVNTPTASTVGTGPGSVTFSAKILAVIYRGTAITATDVFFALPQITYRLPGSNPGAGGFPITDAWVINGNTLDFLQFATNSSALDAVRVLVEAAPVPVPPALVLLLGPLALIRRRLQR